MALPESAVATALGVFRSNRTRSEKALFLLQGQLQDHHHSVFCFRWSKCRTLERRASDLRRQIDDSSFAEKSLAHGDLSSAIRILQTRANEVAPTKTDTWKVAGNHDRILEYFGRNDIARNLRNLAYALSKTPNTPPNS